MRKSFYILVIIVFVLVLIGANIAFAQTSPPFGPPWMDPEEPPQVVEATYTPPGAYTVMSTVPIYKYTGVNFKYIGEFFHEKEVKFRGGSTFFWIEGVGEVRGTQDIRSVEYRRQVNYTNDPDKGLIEFWPYKVNIRNKFEGTAAEDPAISQIRDQTLAEIEAQRRQALAMLSVRLNSLENTVTSVKQLSIDQQKDALIADLENQRLQAIANLNEQARRSPNMSYRLYTQEMSRIDQFYGSLIMAAQDGHRDLRGTIADEISRERDQAMRDLANAANYYDALLEQVTEEFRRIQGTLRIASEVKVLERNATTLQVSVEMDAGNYGYIDQDISARSDFGGEYLRMSNRFGNTGGRTVRNLEVEGFIKERMWVEGSAFGSEKTIVDTGGQKTGWWDPLP